MLIKTIENLLARWFDPDYGGLSSTADYEYLVSSLGYAGYDSLITEKNWQEFMAYEYAVLMDVAEFIWDGQEEYAEEKGDDAYVDKVMGPYPAEYYENDNTGLTSEPTEDQKGPAYLPYLPVTQDYNSAKISKEDWDMLVLAGQPSARFGISNPGALTNSPGFNVSSTIMGGNRDVMPPTLMYEYKINPNEPDSTGSLVPYISVLKEQLKYHYFTVGNREEFESLGANADSGGVDFNSAHIDKVDLMEISQKLNIQNPYIRNSTVWANYWLHADDNPTKGEENWLKADIVHEQNLYFTNDYSSTIYKTALQIMIDRYLPKASLLTSWYYLKDTDIASAETQGKKDQEIVSIEGQFDVEQLMRDVKEIYNYYCWQNPEGSESLTNETIESVTYSGDGTVIRGDDGKAVMGTKNINYATTNNETFIHFGQAGIEANLFNVFHMFEPKGEHASIPRPEAPPTITGDDTLTVVPVITELLSDQAFFMDRFGFKVTFEYKYHYHYYEQVWSQTGSHEYTTIKVPYTHYSHVTTSGGNFKLTSTGEDCSICTSGWSSYIGKSASTAGTERINNVLYYKYKIRTATASGAYDVDGGYHAPGGNWYVSDLIYHHGHATDIAKIIIPYEATKDIQPRGDSYTMDPVSQIIHDQVILKAEETAMQKDFFKGSAEMEIETMEREFVNHGYWYADEGKCKVEGNDFKAEPIGYFDERYHHSLGFYNFAATSGYIEDNPDTAADESNINNANYQKTVKDTFRTEINTAFHNAPTATPAMDPFTGKQMVTSGGTSYNELTDIIKKYLELYYAAVVCTSEYEGCEGRSAIPSGRALVDAPTLPNIPNSRGVTFDYVEEITQVWLGDKDETDITKKYIAQGETDFEISNMILNESMSALESTGIAVEQYNLADGPKYTQVSTQKNKVRYGGLFDIDDYVLSMHMDVPQKRVATMIVTDVEAWAKSATYTISITNNTFDYTNYRYVVPHSYFNFGVKKFRIDENPTYRTTYYKEYFSKINDPNAAIKEADILTMMLKWEEYARSGTDTAYAYMRDLYKLVIYVREKFRGADAQMLETAYTYLYIPDTIWEFREGISQEAFWTERLAAEMPGNADALSQEELDYVRVKKDDISWQILDYDEYSECQYEDGGELKAKVYALFPFGSPYTRTYMMQTALDSGTFNDGGYKNGHAGADWTSRATNAKILADGTSADFDGSIEEQIYEYELKTRTARKILNTSIDLNTRLDRARAVLLGGNTSDPMAEAAAKEIEAELKEYTVKSPIVSVAGGYVTRADYNCYSGFHVAVVHTATGRSADTSYVHMRRWPCVQENDIVGPGTVVGHEGTTGNSRGNHLHQNLSIGGDRDSPAEYMGPIFAPFYNKDKIFETFTTIDTEWGGTKELILGTEYMELIRTVLMYPLNEDGSFNGWLFDGSNMMNNATNATFLKESTFYTENGNTYISFNDTGASGEVGAYNIGSNQVIVKIGGNANPEYYKCSFVWETVSASTNEDELNYNAGTIKRMKVTSKELVEFDDSVLSSGIRVKIDMTSYGTAPVIWGNNVPLSVLIPDMADAVDITVLNTQRNFKPDDYKDEYDGTNGPENNPTKKTSSANVKDVTANPELFTPEEGRLKVPDWMISYMTDVDSPFSVPFYDGPLDLAMQISGVTLGMPGSQSGDVILLKKALIMKGFATSEELDISGEYNDKLVAVLQKVANSGAPYSSINAFGSGATGKRDPEGDGHVNDWSNRGVTDWNAVVTYGSIENAQKAGRAAATQASINLGQREAFIHAVARHESSFIPTAESMIFCGAQADADHSFATNLAYPTETSDYSKGVIEYKGIKRTIRRATGLMQLAPAVGIGRARAKVGDNIDQIVAIMRSPKSNAEIGAEILTDNINSILRNENGEWDTLKSIVDGNSNFAAMYEDCGIDPYQIALMGASALMYNRGPGTEGGQTESNTMRVINSMANITYDGTTVSGSGGICGVGYWVAVMNEVVNNRIG